MQPLGSFLLFFDSRVEYVTEVNAPLYIGSAPSLIVPMILQGLCTSQIGDTILYCSAGR